MARRVVNLASLNHDMTAVAPRIPAPGETILGSEMRFALGGKGGNQAVASARLGADVTVIAAIGADSHGQEYLEALQREGIVTDYVDVIEGKQTGVALIEVDERGQNSILVLPGANHAISIESVERASLAIRNAGAVMSQLEVPFPCVERLFEIARGAGVPTVLNPAPGCSAQEIERILSMTDILVPNEVEVSQLVGRAITRHEELPEAVRPLFDYGISAVIVTLGAAGCAFISPDSFVFLPAYDAHVVDTTGAGDSFLGAFVAYIARAESLTTGVMIEGVDRGSRAASIAVSRVGAQPSLPTSVEVESLSGARDA